MVCVRSPLPPPRNRPANDMHAKRNRSIEMPMTSLELRRAEHIHLAPVAGWWPYRWYFVVMHSEVIVEQLVRYVCTMAKTAPNSQQVACDLSCPYGQVHQVKSVVLLHGFRCSDVASVSPSSPPGVAWNYAALKEINNRSVIYYCAGIRLYERPNKRR